MRKLLIVLAVVLVVLVAVVFVAVSNLNGYLEDNRDTLAAIEKYQVAAGISYISTGGGAFLEFLEGRTLPAVAVLMERAAS